MRLHAPLVLAAMLAAVGTVHAGARDVPLRVVGELDDPTAPPGTRAPRKEAVRRVATARIVTANYALIRADLPATRGLDEPGVDRWLLDHAGYLADSQVRLSSHPRARAMAGLGGTPTNTPIATTGGARRDLAVRPASYGRGLVFRVPGGLIDAKGTGARVPTQGDHTNGLAELGEVLREYAYHQAIEAVLAHADVGVGTVGAYAVIDWGFDVTYANGRRRPAGAILRQAHNRHMAADAQRVGVNQASVVDPRAVVGIERALRRYGFTSTGAHRDLQPHDMLNIQMDRSGTRLVDFGAYRMRPSFPRRAITGWFDDVVVVAANAADHPQPDPRLVVARDDWEALDGNPEFGDASEQIATELARGLRDGDLTRADVESRLGRMTGGVRARLAGQPPPPGAGQRLRVKNGPAWRRGGDAEERARAQAVNALMVSWGVKPGHGATWTRPPSTRNPRRAR